MRPLPREIRKLDDKILTEEELKERMEQKK